MPYLQLLNASNTAFIGTSTDVAAHAVYSFNQSNCAWIPKRSWLWCSAVIFGKDNCNNSYLKLFNSALTRILKKNTIESITYFYITEFIPIHRFLQEPIPWCQVQLRNTLRCHVHESFQLLQGIFPKIKKNQELFNKSFKRFKAYFYIRTTLTVASIDQAVLRCVTWNTDGGRLMVEGLKGHVQGRPCVANWAGQVPEVSKADKNSHGLS